jgi:hypothetical protein
LDASGCDGGDGDNIVDSFLAVEVNEADASHYEPYCQIVYSPLAQRYE